MRFSKTWEEENAVSFGVDEYAKPPISSVRFSEEAFVQAKEWTTKTEEPIGRSREGVILRVVDTRRAAIHVPDELKSFHDKVITMRPISCQALML